MIKKIIIPNTAVKFILLQRTGYLNFHKKSIFKKLNQRLPQLINRKRINHFEACIKHNRIKSIYDNDIKNEYRSIKSYLPENCESILDIGCGVAGIDILLNAHYSNKQVDFYLLDKTTIDDTVYYGFNVNGAFYNSLDVARKMLIKNGVSSAHINLIEANSDNGIDIDSRIELAISLISWGFHYPVETYLDTVYDLLIKGGSIIIDIRKDTNGLDIFKQKFPNYLLVPLERKYYRVYATK